VREQVVPCALFEHDNALRFVAADYAKYADGVVENRLEKRSDKHMSNTRFN